MEQTPNQNLYIPGVNNYLLRVNMVSITENESKTMDFLLRNFSKDYNINQLAKKLEISPAGMFKILKKLKSQDLLTVRKTGNNIIHKINFESKDALDTCVFALTEKKTTAYVKGWIKDLERLREATDIAVLFGSILRKDKEAGDVDVLLVFNRKNFNKVEELIDNLNRIKSKRIHAIYQTKEDLIKNIKEMDKAILDEIRTGIILWGRNALVEAIKDGQG